MKWWLQAAAFLHGATSALAIPIHQHGIDLRDIKTVAGSTGPDHVTFNFVAPCEDCSNDTSTNVEYNINIDAADEECRPSSIFINGLPLVPRGRDSLTEGNLILRTSCSGKHDDEELVAGWNLTCFPDEAALLSLEIKRVIGKNVIAPGSGFAVSFQQVQPAILRLHNRPLDNNDASSIHDSWVRSRLESQVLVVPESLAEEFRYMEDLKAQIHRLHHRLERQECKIAHLIKQKFSTCSGIKCFFNTAIRTAPDAIALIKAHFRHHPDRGAYSGVEHDTSQKQHGMVVLHDEVDDTNGDSHLDKPLPPPSAPPFENEAHDPSDHHGSHSNPPHSGAPESLDHAASPNERPNVPHHHPPPPPPPPPPSSRPEHRPHAFSGGRGPRFRSYVKHRLPMVLLLSSFVLLVLATGIVFRCIKITLRDPRRRQNIASRCEEQRTRRAYRSAAIKHKWRRWWSRLRQPESSTDYEEKRGRILEQEGMLEDVMQSEINDLRRAHEIVGEIIRGERQRERMYHDANFGSSSRPFGGHGTSEGSASGTITTLPPYQPPPPSYETELEGELSVVDGFSGYTPSNTGSTPESSLVDCTSRISLETSSIGTRDE